MEVSVYKGLRIKVLSPEYLIILKLFAGSEQDFIDCAHLWNERIDKRLVRKIAKESFMEGKLKKLMAIAKKV